MAGVEADTQALRSLHPRQDRGDLLEPVADDGPLARHRLDDDLRTPDRQAAAMDLVDRRGHPADPEVLALPHVAAGMHDEPIDPQTVAAFQLFDDGVDRLAIERVIGRAQVDQIRVVRHHRVDSGP